MSLLKKSYILNHNIKKILNGKLVFILKPIKAQALIKNDISLNLFYMKKLAYIKKFSDACWDTVFLQYGDVVKIQETDDDFYEIIIIKGNSKYINKIFYVNKLELDRYGIVLPLKNSESFYPLKDYNTFFINSNINEKIMLSFSHKRIFIKEMFNFNLCYFENKKDEVLLKIIIPIIDLFENYDEMIINIFINGIIDTLKDLQDIYRNCTDWEIKYNMLQHTICFINEIVDSIKELPYKKELFDTVEYMFNKQVETRIENLIKEENIKNEHNAHYIEFLKKVKARRDLLKDFNKPLDDVLNLRE